MFDFASQLGAVIGTSVILFIVTQPKPESDDMEPDGNARMCFKGAKKYSREGRKHTSFGMHDDFDM